MVIEKLMPTQNAKQMSKNPTNIDLELPIAWKNFDLPAPYQETIDLMRQTASRIATGEEGEQVWLLEHPPLYTSGTSAKSDHLLEKNRFPVFAVGRGGQFTYHGPGQRVAYVMLDLKKRGRDVRKFVNSLEAWIIDTLGAFNIDAHRSKGQVGVWVDRPDLGPSRKDKIAAIGVRVSKWVSFHGISLNISPDLDHYRGIIPCGITDQGVTSFHDLGHLALMEEVDIVLRQKFRNQFGPISPSPAPELK